MKILVINAGSSTLKFKLFKMLDKSVICSGLIEKIGEEVSQVHFKYLGHDLDKKMSISEHLTAFSILFDLLFEEGVIVDINELYGVGHRVVHGGDSFYKASLINDVLIDELKRYIPLAPLHNPSNISGMQALSQKAPNVAQVAVFDTAFHSSIPEHAKVYALPYELYKEEHVQRYGFHGSSHSFVAKQASILLNKELKQTNLISLHLGNGASVCAIKKEKVLTLLWV